MKDQDYIFVADESGISNDRWTVVGGLCMHRNTVETVQQSLQKYRKDHNMRAELKWSRVSNGKAAEYEALVDYFFALNNTNRIQFHAIVFDSWAANHRKYNDGDRDKGVSKLYYQLLLHRFLRTCGNHGTLYARLDKRNSSTRLEDLRKMLNAAAARDLGLTDSPLKQLVSIDSKQCDVLQLNDVILGAVCAVRNGRHLLAGGRAAKRHIANAVLEKSGLETFDKSTPARIKNFSIWNMTPRARE